MAFFPAAAAILLQRRQIQGRALIKDVVKNPMDYQWSISWVPKGFGPQRTKRSIVFNTQKQAANWLAQNGAFAPVQKDDLKLPVLSIDVRLRDDPDPFWREVRITRPVQFLRKNGVEPTLSYVTQTEIQRLPFRHRRAVAILGDKAPPKKGLRAAIKERFKTKSPKQRDFDRA